ncbi:uncharacterized protein DNG_09355 [Cephalotrichum gorgonifer]|uniref:GPI anchored serine-threonine rich protein n=1 Tax=Cephalotrichum gorgonifer TaxID=2041049 RepID=A0AAE8N7E2_9PEZI|nr:uncharacterized protein DNG_09355 [Cephalotrichum gorgonifer]
MKWILPIALFGAAVMAADPKCDAENIVEACLESEQAKLAACKTSEYDCICAANQAISTCYNNCPNDSRKVQAEGQVQIACANASVFGTSTKASPTASKTASDKSTPAATTTSEEGGATNTSESSSEEKPNSAADLAMNAGGVLLALAGVMAVVV